MCSKLTALQLEGLSCAARERDVYSKYNSSVCVSMRLLNRLPPFPNLSLVQLGFCDQLRTHRQLFLWDLFHGHFTKCFLTTAHVCPTPTPSCYLSCHLGHWGFWITSSVLSTAIQRLYFRVCPLSAGRMCLPARCGISHVEMPDHCIHSSPLPLTPNTTPAPCHPLLSPVAYSLLISL